MQISIAIFIKQPGCLLLCCSNPHIHIHIHIHPHTNTQCNRDCPYTPNTNSIKYVPHTHTCYASHFHPVPHIMQTCNIHLIRAVADTSSPWPHTSFKQRPNKQAVSPSSASVPECAGGTLAGRVPLLHLPVY